MLCKGDEIMRVRYMMTITLTGQKTTRMMNKGKNEEDKSLKIIFLLPRKNLIDNKAKYDCMLLIALKHNVWALLCLSLSLTVILVGEIGVCC